MHLDLDRICIEWVEIVNEHSLNLWSEISAKGKHEQEDIILSFSTLLS